MDIVVGDSSRFSIESCVAEYMRSPGQRGLGYFVVNLSGRCFGVKEPNATLLACSFDAVQRRIEKRGDHILPFSSEPSASKIVGAYLISGYRGFEDKDRFFGFSAEEFQALVQAHSIIWAPDGDEAFDDGSHILQMDQGNFVRLIAFKNIGTMDEVFGTILDTWLDADEFYNILREWHDRFESAWTVAVAS